MKINGVSQKVFSCLGQAHEFEIALAGFGVTSGDIQDVIDKRKKIKIVSDDFSLNSTYPVTVNYDRDVEEAIRAGKYDWIDSNITSKNFPTKRSGVAKVDIELVHFNHNIFANEVLPNWNERGLRPAELLELLALGEKCPDLQREFPIVAFGSVWQGFDGSCPYLSEVKSGRFLELGWIKSSWGGRCRFAVLRK